MSLALSHSPFNGREVKSKRNRSKIDKKKLPGENILRLSLISLDAIYEKNYRVKEFVRFTLKKIAGQKRRNKRKQFSCVRLYTLKAYVWHRCETGRLCADWIGEAKLRKPERANTEKTIRRFPAHVMISLRICGVQSSFTELHRPQCIVRIFRTQRRRSWLNVERLFHRY